MSRQTEPVSIAIVTCKVLPEPDPDEAVLLDALLSAGLDPVLAAWDDEAVDWAAFELAVIRSPWNYIEHLADFLAWADTVSEAVPLVNAAEVLRWNTHKGYLRDLTDRGLPVVPTAWVGADESVALAEIMAARGWSDVVAKPAVGAGSFLTDRVTDPDSAAAREFWADLSSGREVMVQPYLRSVEEYGERSLVWIDGEFTHAVRKSPRLGDADEEVSDALAIAEDELALATEVISAVRSGAFAQAGAEAAPAAAAGSPWRDTIRSGASNPDLMATTAERSPWRDIIRSGASTPDLIATNAEGSPWRDILYARVDLIRDDEGAPLLAELELVEPSLFLAQSPAALDRLVRAIAHRSRAPAHRSRAT